jgi:hypothetical protein
MAGFAYGGELFSDFWVTTGEEVKKKVISTISREHPLLEAVANMGHFGAKRVEPGKRVKINYLARCDDNVKMSRPEDEMQQSSGSFLETMEFDFRYCYNGFPMNDTIMALHSTKEIEKLAPIYFKQLAQGFKNYFARQLYGGGNTNEVLAMNGLQYGINTNPYETGLVICNLMRGGLPGDKMQFWRNKVAEAVKPNTGGTVPSGSVAWPSDRDGQVDFLYKMIENMLLFCPTGRNIYCNIAFFDLIREAVGKRVEHYNTKLETYQKPTLPHIPVGNGAATVWLDKNCTKNKIYFLDHSTLWFVASQKRNFTPGLLRSDRVARQAYHFVDFMGNFVVVEPRKNGVFTLRETAQGSSGVPPEVNICNLGKITNFFDPDYKQPLPDADLVGIGDGNIEHTGYSATGTPTGKWYDSNGNLVTLRVNQDEAMKAWAKQNGYVYKGANETNTAQDVKTDPRKAQAKRKVKSNAYAGKEPGKIVDDDFVAEDMSKETMDKVNEAYKAKYGEDITKDTDDK